MKTCNEKMEILKDIQVEFRLDDICKALRIRTSDERSRIESLVETAKGLIVARAAYKVGYIVAKFDNAVTIDGIQLTSTILRKNLEEAWRVFPYAVTIGDELDGVAKTLDDLLERFWLDFIGNMALRSAQYGLKNLLCSKYALEQVSSMSPGSLPDWPIEEQKPLFAILGSTRSAIGVTLTDSLVMQPTKSLSGIFFPTQVTFYSCQLCSREGCIGRRAKYRKELAEHYGIEQ